MTYPVDPHQANSAMPVFKGVRIHQPDSSDPISRLACEKRHMALEALSGIGWEWQTNQKTPA